MNIQPSDIIAVIIIGVAIIYAIVGGIMIFTDVKDWDDKMKR